MLELKNSSLSKWFYWEPFYTYFFEKFKDHAFRFFCRKWLIYFPNSDENTFIFEQCRKHFISVSVFILIISGESKKYIFDRVLNAPLITVIFFSLLGQNFKTLYYRIPSYLTDLMVWFKEHNIMGNNKIKNWV